MCRFLLQILFVFLLQIILMEEFIKHDQVNYPCCNVRYPDLYFLLGFLNFIFCLLLMFFPITLHNGYWVVLIRCVHKFFDLHLRVFMLYVCTRVQNLMEETIWSMYAQESLKVLGALRLLSLEEKNYLLKWVFEVRTILILYIGSKYIDEYIKCFN